MRVYPFGVYLRSFIHKYDAVNRGRNCEFGAGDSDSCIITMSPPPTSSITKKTRQRDESTHSGERGARDVCTLSETNRNGAIC